MPAQSVRTSATGIAPAVPLNGYYPKWLTGDSGSVWLMTAPKTGVLVHLGNQPFGRKKTVGVGYATTKLKEALMRPYTGSVTINVAA